jgi:DNA (cytosine-5)-methyltransferase 1
VNFLSICSGIEAASVAWHPLGWRAVAFSEIEPFPCAVLAHHFPSAPNFGDMTKFKEWPDAVFDVLVGGTPCQSFSVAGLRKGLDDPRGNLMLTYLAIAERYRPVWLVWENVPGVLSSNKGRDFGTFLGALAKLGYGFAYRILDAQHFGVPQRRRRVFVVGYLGDWRCAAAVLFERESLSGNPAPRRETRQDIAHTISARTRGGGGLWTDFDCDGGLIASTGDIAHCLNAGGMGRQDFESETLITHSLRADGFDASEDGTGRGTPLTVVPILEAGARTGVSTTDPRAGSGIGESGDPMYTLQSGKQHAVAFHENQRGELTPNGGRSGIDVGAVAVRRLTPRECERLQGFPDDYTLVPFRGKPAADGPRYKALGNSMAVPVMRWIGERIQLVEGAA